jgi:hypothetical protein
MTNNKSNTNNQKTANSEKKKVEKAQEKSQAGSQKQTKNQKKKAKKNNQTMLAKSVPVTEANVGDKNSNKMASEVSSLVAEGAVSAMTGASMTFQLSDLLNNSYIYNIARNLVHKLNIELPSDSTTTDSATTWSSSGALMYLVWALFDSLRASGVLQNPAVQNSFPAFPPDANIPVAWAQVLQYLKPFLQGTVSAGFDDNTIVALPTAPTNNSVGPSGTGFALDAKTQSGAYPWPTAGGTEAQISFGSGSTWAQIYTAAPFISNAWSRGLSCTKYGTIPRWAPDASAYATPTYTGDLICFTPKFNSEVATCLGISGATGQGYYGMNGYVKPSPVIPGMAPVWFWFVETFQECAFLPGKDLQATLDTHAWNQTGHPEEMSLHGRVKRHSPYQKFADLNNPVRFLFGNTLQTDTRCYQSLVAACISAMCPVGTMTAGQLYAIAVVCMSALVAKLLPYSYVPLTIGGSVATTAYNPIFMNIPLPVAVATVLNSLGPIVLDGRMHYPHLFATPLTLQGAWIQMSTLGLSANAISIYGSFFAGTNSQNFAVGLYTFNSTNFTTPSAYGATPIASANAFLNSYNAALSPLNSVGQPTVPLIKPDSHNPVGKSNQIVYADLVTLNAANFTPVATGITVNEFGIKAIASHKDILGDELGLAISCPVAVPINASYNLTTIQAINLPYRAAVGGSNRTMGIQAFAQNCNSPYMSTAIANTLASIKRETYSINGNTVDVSKNGDLFGAILDNLVAPILGDAVSEGIKSGPLGKIGSFATPLLLGGPALLAADKLGITDGVVSSFGLSTGSKQKFDKASRGVSQNAPNMNALAQLGVGGWNAFRQ